MFKIAVQLYSLREQLKAETLDNALRKVAEAGYDGVETWSFDGLTAPELKEKLNKAALSCPSMHVSLELLYGDLDKVISDALTLGASFIVIPWSRAETEADVQEIIDFARQNAPKLRENGLRLLYHNHWQEFKPIDNGRNFFDLLLENTDNSQINLQADVLWVKEAGPPIAAFISKVKERLGGFHLKDHCEVGAGSIDFGVILKAARELGQEWLIVEQEEFDIDPYESIRISLENIREIEKGNDL